MSTDQPLFDLEPAELGAGAMETAVRRSIEAQMHRFADDPSGLARAQLAIALAQNIDRGNRKGRAIGNEALQLDTIIDKLAGVEVDGSGIDQLPEEVKRLYEALGELPRIGPAPVRDTA